MITSEKIAPNNDGLFYEARVSEALGVSRKLLAKLRGKHLSEGVGFRRMEANAVALTLEGLAVVEKALEQGDDGSAGLPDGKPARIAGKPASNGDVPAGPPPREVMLIERVPQNPNILLCVRSKPAARVAVRVRENFNFAAGMQIECVQGGGVWQFRNRASGGKPAHESSCGRLPRRKGVW